MPVYEPTITQVGNWGTSGTWSVLPALSTTATMGARYAIDLHGKRWESASLLVEDTGGGAGTGTITVYVVEMPTVPTFSTSFRPHVSTATVVGAATGDPVTPGLTVPLSLNTSVGVATRVRSVLSAGNTTTQLGLLLSWSGSSFLAGPVLSATYTDQELTGLEGPWRAQGRADRCPRCGMPSTRDTWVRDGYNPGLRVCPKCYDPPDEVGRHTRVGSEKPPVGEDG